MDLHLFLGRWEVVRVLRSWMHSTAAGRRDAKGKRRTKAAARATPGSERKPNN